jgi:hypothetical protein
MPSMRLLPRKTKQVMPLKGMQLPAMKLDQVMIQMPQQELLMKLVKPRGVQAMKLIKLQVELRKLVVMQLMLQLLMQQMKLLVTKLMLPQEMPHKSAT